MRRDKLGEKMYPVTIHQSIRELREWIRLLIARVTRENCQKYLELSTSWKIVLNSPRTRMSISNFNRWNRNQCGQSSSSRVKFLCWMTTSRGRQQRNPQDQSEIKKSTKSFSFPTITPHLQGIWEIPVLIKGEWSTIPISSLSLNQLLPSNNNTLSLNIPRRKTQRK